MDDALAFWAFLILTIWSYSLGIVIKQKLFKPFAIIAILISIFPIAWVAFDCYQNTGAEACVWGKYFIVLYLGFAVIFTTPILFLIYYFGRKVWRSFRST